MAYWFHRNPLKATGPVTFELRGAATNGQAQKICRLVIISYYHTIWKETYIQKLTCNVMCMLDQV